MISERYYRNLAQKISENLLNFVDGKPKSFSKSSTPSSSLLASSFSSSSSSNETPVTCDSSKPSASSSVVTTNTLTNGFAITSKNSNKLASSSNLEAKEQPQQQQQLNLKAYNFPPHFSLNENDNEDGKHDESEIAMMSFLLDGQLKRYQSSMEAATSYPLPIKSSISSSNSLSKNVSTVSFSKPVTRSSNSNIQNKSNNSGNNNNNRNDINNSSQMISALEANESQNLHNDNNNNPSKCIFICNVCGHGFSSLDAFDEHEINNHPNVICNYIEMKMEHSIAITLLNWINNSPMGLLKSCKVPDLSAFKTNADSSPCIQCTKCKAKFKTVECLHQHIMTCASSQPPISSISSDLASEKPTRSNTKSSKLTSTSSSPELSKSSSSSEFSLSPSKIKSTITPSPVKREKRKVSPSVNSEASKEEISKDTVQPSKKNKSDCVEPNYQSQETKTANRFTATKVKSHSLRTRADDKNSSRNLSTAKNRSRCKRKCPDCSRVFKHLGYFKRHIKSECPKKDHQDTTEKTQSVASKAKTKTSPSRINTRNMTKKTSESPPTPEAVQSENEYTPTDFQTGQKKDSEQCDSSNESKAKVTSKNGKVSRSAAKKFDPWKVKQEYPLYAFKGSPSQHHSCPHCRRGFTYLANYSRHIREDCPIKFQESLKKQIREGFERCLLKTRDALRKTFAQMNLPHPSEEPLISTNEDGSKESID